MHRREESVTTWNIEKMDDFWQEGMSDTEDKL